MDPSPIVLFGEGNFTFSIALASLRTNGPNGITATGWRIEIPKFDDAKKNAEQYCILNGDKMQLSPQEVKNNAERVSEVLDFSNTWKNNVTALKFAKSLINVAGKVVWFQCPWTVTNSRKTASLIKCFMQNMEKKQGIGDILVIGISTHKDYIREYNLQNILGERSGEDVIYGYRYLGHDNNIIRMILGRGYKHEGYREIHNYIIDTHSTLVFRREGDDDVSGLTKKMDRLEGLGKKMDGSGMKEKAKAKP